MDIATLIGGVVSSIIATILIAIYFRWHKRIRAFIVNYSRRRDFHRRIDAAGITNFYGSRTDRTKYRDGASLEDYLRNAKKTILFSAYWLAQATELEGFAKALCRMSEPPRCLDITVAIVDPTSLIVESLASYLGASLYDTKYRIQMSLYRLWLTYEQMSADAKARFHIKIYSALPIASVLIIDGETADGKVQIDFKAYAAPRDSSFTFEMEGQGSALYELCKDSWTRLAADSEQFNYKKHLGDFKPDLSIVSK